MAATSVRRKLALIRELMRERGLDAYIVPGTDPHLGEYIPDHWRIVEWISGFTGSSATIVITKSFAGLWTDSRYFLQAEEQLGGTGIDLMKTGIPGFPSVAEWLVTHIRKGGLIGFDGRIVSVSIFRKYREAVLKKEVSFVIDADLIAPVWENRPPMPESVVYDHPVEYCGQTRERKIELVREEMSRRELEFHLLTSPDDIMWMLNIRAGDVRFSPLLLSYALVGHDQVLLFTDQSRIPPKLAAEFDRNGIVILPYDEVSFVLSSLIIGSSVLLSPGNTSAALFQELSEKAGIVEGRSIPSELKSVKNKVEIENIRRVMIRDGVALTRFFHWIELNAGRGITEQGAAKMLLEMRLQQANCTGESFPAIVAFNEHSALPHYSAAETMETPIGKDGILLVDSGGQYLDGTTDITRCMSTGRPAAEIRHDFTLALKGTISLAMARFPQGTRGYQLDILARKALWDNGLDYGHGTGHGVGFFLNVHESPPALNRYCSGGSETELVPGMVLSDEPAIYRPGKYGFRTENLLIVTEGQVTEHGRFLTFETLSLCHIDLTLVEKQLLSSEELKWLKNYNETVFSRLSPLLNEAERVWLKNKTAGF